MDLTIENRHVKPGVYPIFQNENNTTVLKFTLDSYIHDDTIDLRNFKAYAVTSINGRIDMTELSSKYDAAEDALTLEWNVQEYSLREPGAIQYQIVFKESADDGENTGVYYTYKAILLNRSSILADEHITANYPTLLKQWLDRIEQLSGDLNKGFVYIPYGTSIPPSERLENSMYWQWDNAEETEGHFEDNQGNKLTFSQYKEKTKYLANQDLLGEMTNFADQHYITAGSDVKNAPITTAYCLVKQYDSESTDRFIQEVQIPDSNNVVRTFVRCVTGDKENGISKVGAWRELVTDVDVDSKIKTVESKITVEENRAKAAEKTKIGFPDYSSGKSLAWTLESEKSETSSGLTYKTQTYNVSVPQDCMGIVFFGLNYSTVRITVNGNLVFADYYFNSDSTGLVSRCNNVHLYLRKGDVVRREVKTKEGSMSASNDDFRYYNLA